jgi:flagellar biosynthesis/type III secretory pathway protein FliH
MIYLKNIRDKQTVHIPRTEINSKVVVIKSYDEGYADGIAEGKKLQKLKLTNLTVSENGVYKREDGWNEVKVDVEIPENIGNTQEKTLIVTKNIDIVVPDSGYDAMTKVSVNATQYGQNKRDEGYQDGYDKGKLDAGNEGYTEGYADGYSKGETNGISEQKAKLQSISITKNGTYNKEDGYNKITVNVPDVNGSYDEGYDKGFADGKAEGGEINLVELDETPKMGDGENNIIEYKPSNYNADGFSNVKINVTSVYHSGYMEGNTEGYNQGYNAGYEEGKGSGSTTSKIKVFDYGVNIQDSTFTTIPEWMDFEGVTYFREAFRDCEKLTVVNDINTNSATSMMYMFWNCRNLTTVALTCTNVTTMEGMFDGCNKLNNVILTATSNVTNMSYMFQDCWMLTSLPLFTTSKALGLARMFDGCINLTNVENLKPNAAKSFYSTFRKCTKLTSIPALNASNLEYLGADLFGDTDLPNLTDFGGLVGLKISSNSNEGFVRTPNLTLESCLNILNGLYDFTGNGKTPTIEQGKLKVHQNFLNLVGDQISIASNKGWTITA